MSLSIMRIPLAKGILGCTVILALLAGIGCVYLAPKPARLFLYNRYSELETYMESKYAQLASIPPEELPYLCSAYFKLKRYNKIFPCTDQMESNVGRGTPLAVSLWLWDNSDSSRWLRAMTYTDLGNYSAAVQEASSAYEQALKRDLSPFQKALALSSLSLAYALRGDRDEALKYAKLLEAVPTYGKYTSLRTDILNNLAIVSMALGDFNQALAALDRLDVGQGTWRVLTDLSFGPALEGESLFTYQVLPRTFMRNKALYETGRVAEAKEGYRKLAAEPATRENGDIYWLILFDLGRIAETDGDKAEAIRQYKEVVEVIEQQRSTINTMAGKIGYVGDRQKVYGRLVAALVAQGQEASAFEYVERAKSRALVDLLASRKDFASPQGQPTEIADLLGNLESQELALHSEGAEAPLMRAQRGVVVTRVKDQLRRDLPVLASLVTVNPIATQDIQAALRPDETLVEYYQAGAELYAFTLTREAVKAFRLDGTDLAAHVGRLRLALQNPRDRSYEQHSSVLYERLLRPVEGHLKTPRLVIVPHGSLHYLPFNALTSESGFVIDRWAVRYLPSASVTKFLPTFDGPRGVQEKVTLLAIGNPKLDRPELQLHFSEVEALKIAELFPGSTVLVGKDATETAFRRLAPRFTYLHFATHGLFDSSSPLQSGLILTRDAGNDGLLAVDELYTLRLNAALVTLSACETGLGKVSHGDDVIGLTRGFLYAGADSILASLWPVDDEATLHLMTDFYRNLKTLSKVDALRETQLAARKRYPHPYYWASFQLTGSAR